MASGGTTITLSRRYESGGKSFEAITLREPRFADYMAIGEVQEWQPIAGVDKAAVLVEDTDKIRRYAERLIEGDALRLDLLALIDALKVRRAILDFFAEARAPDGPPTT